MGDNGGRCQQEMAGEGSAASSMTGGDNGDDGDKRQQQRRWHLARDGG